MTPNWTADWLWGLPLLVLTIVAHVCAIVATASLLGMFRASKQPTQFVAYVATAALTSTVFLALEAAAWSLLYLSLGALPDWRAGMLYSLSAITSFGHASVFLEDRWQLLGAIEAVNGMILFGLTTAFLFAAIHRIWPIRNE